MSNPVTTVLRYGVSTILVYVLLSLCGFSVSAQTLIPRMAAPVLEFTQNSGQIVDFDGKARPDILYTAEGRGVKLYMSANVLSYVFQQVEGDLASWRHHDEGLQPGEKEPLLNLYRLDLEFVGANPMVKIERQDETKGYKNFYLPQCPDGLLGVKSFRTVVYRELYRNIDMVMRAREDGSMKIDFVIHPGGNPSDIRIRPVGASDVKMLPTGGTRVETPLGFLEEDQPISFTVRGNLRTLPDTNLAGKHSLSSSWKLSDGVYSFTVEGYDRRNTLVIDPTKRWATYIGGSGTEDVRGADPTEVDRTGNALITGSTTNAAFPTSAGAFQTTISGSQDIFVFKIKYDNTRMWATLYGGSDGGGTGDLAHGIVSDGSRNVYIAGHTTSSNFPVNIVIAYGGNRDGFIVKFDSTGTRQWARFFGGSQLDDSYGFAIDSASNPAMILTTGSSGIATLGQTSYGGGTYDGMIAKFNGTSGSLIWSTYLGGSGTDAAYAASSDIYNNIIVAGWAGSGFPVSTGAAQTTYGGGTFDAFVGKYNSSGTRLWQTFCGGSANECDDGTGGGGVAGHCGLATDLTGNVFLVGFTESTNFPVGSAIQPTKSAGTGTTGRDAFIAKYDTAGVKQWSTYFGTANVEDAANSAASNNSGSVLVVGYSRGVVPSITPDRMQATNAGSEDIFVLKLSANGQTVKYCTMYGGNGADGRDGAGVSFDPFGSIYFGGETASNNLSVGGPLPSPPWPATFQSTYAGSTDAFLCLLCDIEGGVIQKSGPDTMCLGDTLRLSVPPGYKSYSWSYQIIGAGPPNVGFDTSTSIRVLQNTNADYWVDVTNHAGCSARSDTIRVRYRQKANPQITTPAQNPAVICQGTGLLLKVTGQVPGQTYSWFDGTLTTVKSTMIGSDPWVPDTLTPGSYTYRAIVQDIYGCLDTTNIQTVIVQAKSPAVTIVKPPKDTICQGDPLILSANRAPLGDEQFTWSIGGGNGQTMNVTSAGVYYINVVRGGVCTSRSDSVRITIRQNPIPVISGQLNFCEGDTMVFRVSGQKFKTYQWSTGETGDTARVWGPGALTVMVTDSFGCRGQRTVNLNVEQKPKPIITSRDGRTIICQGDSVWLDVPGIYGTYSWSNGVFGTPSIMVKDSGTYFVRVTTALGQCPGISDSIKITVRPKPSAALAGPIAVCTGSTASYTAPKATGVSYAWTVSGAGGTIQTGSGTDSITVRWGNTAGTGTVKVTITDPITGCFRDTTITVAVGSALKPAVQPGTSISICPGDSVTLSVGGGYTQYTWTDAGGTQLGTQPTLTVKTAGTYYVDIKDAGGCAGKSDPINVTISTPPTPNITVVEGRTTICPGGTLTLDPGSFASYLWGGGQSIQKLVITDSGTYSVTVSNSSNCKGTATIRITRAAVPAPSVNGPASVCINSTSQYTVPGAKPGNTYQWTLTGGIGNITGGQGTSTVTVNWTGSGPATLEVEETDATTTCKGRSLQFPVTVGTSLTPSITTQSGKTVFCAGDSIILRAPGYTTYTWKDGGGTTVGSADSLVVKASGTYSVDVSDGTCAGNTTITVTQKAPVSVSVTPPTTQLCQGDSVVLRATAGFSRYSWSNGDTTQTIVVKATGNYTVTVSDVDGCVGASTQASVTVNPKPVASIAQVDTTLTASPAGASYQWLLNGAPVAGATSQTYVAKADGAYRVIVTGAGGCKDTSTAVTVSGSASATVAIAQYTASPGDHITIPIQMLASQGLQRYNLKTYTAKIRFNKTLLVAPSGPGITGTTIGKDRVVTVTGTLPANVLAGATPAPITQLDFVAALGDTTETDIVIESFSFSEGAAAVVLQDGHFTLQGICTSGGQRLVDATGTPGLKAVRPNPAKSNATISYELVEDGKVALTLVNVLGQTIPLWSGQAKRGQYALDVDAQKLSSGNYVLVLETPSGQWTMPVSIQK